MKIVREQDLENISDAFRSNILLLRAMELFIGGHRPSVSTLARKLKTGYRGSATILDTLEELGCIGPYRGEMKRELMITQSNWVTVQRLVIPEEVVV